MKKSISFVLMVVLLLTIAPAMPLTVKAETSGYYTYEVYDGEAIITEVDQSISGDVVIPATLGGYPVTDLSVAFMDCVNITSVTIPDSVTNLEAFPFRGCGKLKKIYISDLALWCQMAYHPGGGELTYEETIYDLYVDGEKVTDLVIPEGITELPMFAFYGCSSLESVVIPEGVTQMSVGVFGKCVNLKRITIPASLTAIFGSIASGCGSLTGIWVDEGNPEYCSDERGVLYNRDKTLLIKVPATLDGDFVVSDSITEVDGSAFKDCRSLTGIWVDEGNPSYCSDEKGVLYNRDKTCLYMAPSSISGNYTIPEGVCEIESNAFVFCNGLTALIIPDSVTIVWSGALSKCSNLKTIYYCGDQAQWQMMWQMMEFGDYTFLEKEDLRIVYNADELTSGDLDGVAGVDNKDVEFLLWHTLFPEDYLLPSNADFDGNGPVDNKDVEYLLWHTLFPEDYPL